MGTVMLEIRDLRKEFTGSGNENVRAVDDVSIDVEEGQFLTLDRKSVV